MGREWHPNIFHLVSSVTPPLKCFTINYFNTRFACSSSNNSGSNSNDTSSSNSISRSNNACGSNSSSNNSISRYSNTSSNGNSNRNSSSREIEVKKVGIIAVIVTVLEIVVVEK